MIQTCIFSNNWYQSGLQFRICITCFVSFGIRDSNFMLEDYTINFLHVHWNYCLIKNDIDVMMLFKFDVMYVKLNFKAMHQWNPILISNSVYYVHMMVLCSWKTVKNCFRKILENLCFMSFDRSIEIMTNLFDSIDIRLLVNWSNVLYWSIEQWSSTNRAKQIIEYEFFNFFNRLRYTFTWSKTVNFEFF